MKTNRLIQHQITRASLIWLLISQVMVVIPFMFYLPVWLLPLVLLSAAWRLRALKGHWQAPGRLVKWSAAILGVAGLAASGMATLSLEAAATLLMLGFALKNLELNQRRDALLVVFIGYFLVATLFLFDQGLLSTIYALLLLVLLTGSLISLHQARSHGIRGNLKLAVYMLVQCLPLMIAAYLFFPRLPPLWAVPMAGAGKTGVSDQITPGDIANLAQSSELAFKASFEGERPPQSDLYWRGLVLNHFDGKTWSQFAYQPPNIGPFPPPWPGRFLGPPDYQAEAESLRYRMIYQPTQQNWMFTLSPSRLVRGEAQSGYDFRHYSRTPLTSVTSLTLDYFPEAVLDPELTDRVRRQTLALPANQNPRTQELARRLRGLVTSDESYALSVLQWFGSEDFRYTLSPLTLGDTNTIDRFLFETRLGFCSHFASAYTNLMRMVGIPARIVAGYQGGEWNEQGGFISVRQFDAHAWVEIWLPERGWVRVDPTSVVAPDRIEQNLREALREENSFLANAGLRGLQFSVFNNLRLHLENLQYRWQSWVLGYDVQEQTQLLTRLLGNITVSRVIILVIGLMGGIAVFWVLILGLHRNHNKPSEHRRQFELLIDRLQNHQIPVTARMSPTAVKTEVKKVSADWTVPVIQYLEQLNQHLYQNPDQSILSRAAFFNLLRQIRRSNRN